MRICITGALGHIGSALIRRLQSPQLEKVYLVDNMLTQRYVSLFDLPMGIPFQFEEIDINSKRMKEIISDCDVLIHLAAITNAEMSFERQKEVEEVNIKGLAHIANECAVSGCKLLFPSSTSVYGSQDKQVDEKCPDDELKPQTPYADSKLFGERLLRNLSQQQGLRYVIFRVGTIFGYSLGMRFHTAVNKFCWQASMGVPITVWRTALHQKRPYCGVIDAARAFQFFMEDGRIDNRIYNIVTQNFTVNDIIEKIKKYMPDVLIQFVDSPIMNQLSYEVSNARSLASGFTYEDMIDVGIGQTMAKLVNAYLPSSCVQQEVAL